MTNHRSDGFEAGNSLRVSTPIIKSVQGPAGQQNGRRQSKIAPDWRNSTTCALVKSVL
jgi:hypothetical protein